ncbi:MAG: hypothetical protein J6Y62_01880 [Clostridia bacterium]|nr:hypothetical protein [Clostridia bacterium]
MDEYGFKNFQEDMGWGPGGFLLHGQDDGPVKAFFEGRIFVEAILELGWLALDCDKEPMSLVIKNKGWGDTCRDGKGRKVDMFHSEFILFMSGIEIFKAYVFHKSQNTISPAVLKMVAKAIHEAAECAQWSRCKLECPDFFYKGKGNYDGRYFNLEFGMRDQNESWLDYWRGKLGNRELTLIRPPELAYNMASHSMNASVSGYEVGEMLFELKRGYFESVKRNEERGRREKGASAEFFASMSRQEREWIVEGFQRKPVWIPAAGSVWTWDAGKKEFFKGVRRKEKRNDIRI